MLLFINPCLTLTQYILKVIEVDKNIAESDASGTPNRDDKTEQTEFYMKMSSYMIFTKYEFQNFFTELIFYVIILRLREIQILQTTQINSFDQFKKVVSHYKFKYKFVISLTFFINIALIITYVLGSILRGGSL